MPDYVVWIIIGLVAAIIVAVAITLIVKVAKMPADERKELIVSFLVGLVTTAEQLYTEHGKGSEKLQEVEDAFNRTAPWFLKLLLKITKTATLEECIEVALDKAKSAWVNDAAKKLTEKDTEQ